MAGDLTLGPEPGRLRLVYVLDDPWTCHLTLKLAGTPTPWPAAPVLEFAAGITWAATLSETDTKATWARSVADVAALHAATAEASTSVRLSADAVTQWVGRVARRA